METLRRVHSVENAPYKYNYRPTQPINGRKVEREERERERERERKREREEREERYKASRNTISDSLPS